MGIGEAFGDAHKKPCKVTGSIKKTCIEKYKCGERCREKILGSCEKNVWRGDYTDRL